MLQTCVVGSRNADGLEELEKDGTSACGNGGGSQKIGNKGDVTDRIGARNASVEKEESRTTTRKVRVELTLPRNREKEKSVETRETFGQDQGECGDGESPQENAEQAFQLELDCKKTKIPNLFSQNSAKTSTRFRKNRRSQPNQRDDVGWSCGKT